MTTITAEQISTKKCKFCAESILIDAIKCKHCGTALSGKAKNKISVMFGSISIIAVIMCGFVPAFTTPLILLVAVIFGFLEVGLGSKIYGVISLILCLLTGYQIGQHFTKVSEDITKSQKEISELQKESDYENYGRAQFNT